MSNSKGFTIIELLVVLSFIAVISTMIISNFSATKLQFSLSGSAHAFAQNVRKAQNLTLSSSQYHDADGQVLSTSGYGVYISPGSLGDTKYIIYADKFPGNQEYDSEDYVVESIDIGINDPGIIIKEITNITTPDASINFSPPDPTTTIAGLAPDTNSIEVVFAEESDLENTRTVFINTSGLVEVN